MSDSVLKVEEIAKAFGGVQALKGVSLEIGKGEIHCLAGENGSGKSTLIKVISGVHEPDAGIIEIEGRCFSRIAPMQAIALGVQVIYQDFSVFPNLSVMENLALNMQVMDATGPDGLPPCQVHRDPSGFPDRFRHRPRRARRDPLGRGPAASSPSAAPCSRTRSSSLWTSRPPLSQRGK